MTAAEHRNARAAARVVRRLRSDDVLTADHDLLVALLTTSADLLDAACSAGSDVSATGRSHVLRAHVQVVELFGRLVTPPMPDAFADLLRELSTPSYG